MKIVWGELLYAIACGCAAVGCAHEASVIGAAFGWLGVMIVGNLLYWFAP